ncbi:MAG: DUF6362 family protein [Pseudomonadota bacterium]
MSKDKKTEYTANMLADRFEEALYTLKRLYVPGTKPRGYFNAWPAIVYETWEIEAMEKLPMRLGPPTPDAISRMEEVFTWLWHIKSVEDRHLIWLRARKTPWKTICKYRGCGRTKAWQDWVFTLSTLAHRLNQENSKKKQKN